MTTPLQAASAYSAFVADLKLTVDGTGFKLYTYLNDTVTYPTLRRAKAAIITVLTAPICYSFDQQGIPGGLTQQHYANPGDQILIEGYTDIYNIAFVCQGSVSGDICITFMT